MQKNKYSTYFIFVAIFTLATIFVFIVSKSYDSLMLSINTAQNSSLGKNTDLNLKIDVIEQIELRK